MNAHEKFLALTPNEIAAPQVIAAHPADNAEIVAPIPPGALPLDVKFKGRQPDEFVWFLDRNGERMFAECRWNLDGSAKEICLARCTVQGWKLLAQATPTPLYNLDKLAARADGAVWLFEAPRKAEKAELCFRDAVTTAYAGGPSAIKRTIFRHCADATWSSGAMAMERQPTGSIG